MKFFFAQMQCLFEGGAYFLAVQFVANRTLTVWSSFVFALFRFPETPLSYE